MSENDRKAIREKKNTIRVAEFSRRQFLKRAGVVAAGAAVASISLASACKSSGSTIAGTTTGVNPTTGEPTKSNAPTSSSTTPSSSLPVSSSTTPTSLAPTSIVPATNTPAVTGYSYVPPTALPPLITVTGTTCTVATDRLYSADNIWAKSLSANIVVMGITTTMVEILYEPYNLSLSQVGTTLASGDAFGIIAGYKMTADLISPVSGTLVEINNFLIGLGKQGSALISPINDDPYDAGWMVVVQLSKPDELKSLMSAQSYRDLVAKK